jgi:hypothetical protein
MIRVNNIHIDAVSLSCPKSLRTFGRNVPATSEIDNKNRADSTVGPVVKNYGPAMVTTSCWRIAVGTNWNP